MMLLLLLVLPLSRAFAPATRLSISSDTAICNLQTLRPTAAKVIDSRSSSKLNAKKRRRRKAVPTPANSDELPDFDDGEDNDSIAKDVSVASSTVDSPMQQVKVSSSTLGDAISGRSSTSSTPIKRGTGLNQQLAEEVGGNVDGLDEDTILEAMRGKAGTSWTPPRSIDDTLRDRRLEKFMDFDKMIEQDGGGDGSAVDLPDFEEVIARRRGREAVQEGRVVSAYSIYTFCAYHVSTNIAIFYISRRLILLEWGRRLQGMHNERQQLYSVLVRLKKRKLIHLRILTF